MDEQPQIFLAAQRAFTDRVHAVTDAQWSSPTPNSEWSVADLVDHLIDEHRWFPPLMHGHDLEAAGKVVEGARAGADPDRSAVWDEVAVASSDAVMEPDALDRTVVLSRGDTAAGDYVTEMTMDLIVHAWDLGKAIGFDQALPPDLAEFGYEQVRGWGDVSASGYFQAPVSVPDDASAEDKLVGLTGRDPNWTAP
jgi:uncharacterized protein (TIGR03086 family)